MYIAHLLDGDTYMNYAPRFPYRYSPVSKPRPFASAPVLDADALLDQFNDLQDRANNFADLYAEQAPAIAAKKALTPGVYQNGTGIYILQYNKEKTGMYTKKATITGDSVKFEYDWAGIRTLLPEHKLSVEAAAALGCQVGTCMVCARTLTDPKSVAAGIGPVCAKNQAA